MPSHNLVISKIGSESDALLQTFMKRVLPLEKQRVHFPEFPLRPGRLGRFGCLLRLVMNAGKRVVAEDDPQSGSDILLKVPEDPIQTPAIWAFVIPVLNECAGGIL